MLISVFLDVVCHFLCVTTGLVRQTELKKSVPEYQVGNELPVKFFFCHQWLATWPYFSTPVHKDITANKEAYMFPEGAESKGIQCNTAI
jgi:hypothetical protein